MDDLRQREIAMRELAKTVNAGRKPVFGDYMRNPWASESNPHRDAYFVRSGFEYSRCNHGAWYEFTDKKGEFWRTRADFAMFIDQLSAGAIAAAEGEAKP